MDMRTTIHITTGRQRFTIRIDNDSDDYTKMRGDIRVETLGSTALDGWPSDATGTWEMCPASNGLHRIVVSSGAWWSSTQRHMLSEVIYSLLNIHRINF